MPVMFRVVNRTECFSFEDSSSLLHNIRPKFGTRHTLPANTARMAILFAAKAVALGLVGAAIGVNSSAQLRAQESTVREQTPAEAPQAPARRVVVRFLTDADFPPFNFYDEEGVLAGFNIDLARAICLEINAQCDIKVRPWEELFVAMRRGEADAIIAGHAVTARSVQQVDFSDRYFHTPGRFAASKTATETEITPEGLDGKKIAVAKGTPHEAFLKMFFRDSSVQAFETAELAREALGAGKVDYVFDDGIGLAFWLNGTLSRQCCEFKGGPFLEPKFFGDGIAIAIPKTDPQLKTLINAALKKVRANGRFEELVQRYFPVRVY